MNATEVAEALKDLIEACEIPDELMDEPIARVETFKQVGMLTRDAGLVITLKDRSEFQVTVVRSRRGRDEDDE